MNENIQNQQKVDVLRQKAEEAAFFSDWGLDGYANFLGINPIEMKGKLVLDLGAGENEKFSKEAKKEEINVVSVSPHILKPKKITKEFLNGWLHQSISARGQQLPFKDNTFDYEVALNSVPFFLPYSEDEYVNFFSEVARTLKPRGKAYFYPILVRYDSPSQATLPISVEFITGILEKVPDIKFILKEDRSLGRLVVEKFGNAG